MIYSPSQFFSCMSYVSSSALWISNQYFLQNILFFSERNTIRQKQVSKIRVILTRHETKTSAFFENIITETLHTPSIVFETWFSNIENSFSFIVIILCIWYFKITVLYTIYNPAISLTVIKQVCFIPVTCRIFFLPLKHLSWNRVCQKCFIVSPNLLWPWPQTLQRVFYLFLFYFFT